MSDDSATNIPLPEYPPHILIVDDDPVIIESLKMFFFDSGWEVSTASTGSTALEIMLALPDLDLVLLDLHLPDRSGLDVLERSQALGVVAPVLIISISVEDDDRIRALGLGAQDYITKPYDPDKLLDRIEQIIGLKRTDRIPPGTVVSLGDVVLDFNRGQLCRNSQTLNLDNAHRDLMRILLENRGVTVSRKRLLKEALGVDQESFTYTLTRRALYDAIDQYMGQIFELIDGNPVRSAFFERVYGQGYRARI